MGITEWASTSRFHYALVWGGLTTLVVVGLNAAFGSWTTERLLVIGLVGFIIAFLAQAFIWYPRAQKKMAEHHGSVGTHD